MNHPNAVTSAISGGVGGSIVIAVLNAFNVHISLYDAGLIYTAVSAFVLFVGKNGLQGVYNAVLHGKDAPAPAPAPKKKKNAGP